MLTQMRTIFSMCSAVPIYIAARTRSESGQKSAPVLKSISVTPLPLLDLPVHRFSFTPGPRYVSLQPIFG